MSALETLDHSQFTLYTQWIKPNYPLLAPTDAALQFLNPLTPMSDLDKISPYNVNAISTR